MLYRRFGRTELNMPVFTCGGMRYQHQWQDAPWSEIPASGQANLEATIQRALDLGINHIETARGYGTSEMQLGRILPTYPRDQLIVQTKVAPAVPQEFLKTFEKSMAYLQLDYVDLLSIHGINTREHIQMTLKQGGCLDIAHQLVDQGRVRFVGFSTHGSLEIILETIQSNAFDYVNLHWYYINQLNWPAILAASERDMGVFIISPSDKGGKLYTPPAKLVECCHPLSPMVFNDLFCLSQPQVHTLSIGAARPTDFDEHLKALSLLDIADQLLPPILHRLEDRMIQALGENYARHWRQGLPPYEKTPGKVNIPVILWLHTLVKAYDMIDYAQMRYNLLGNGSHWFPGEKADQVSPHILKSCLRDSPFRDQIPELLQEAHQILNQASQKRLSQKS
jgi:predicted aldo/keto reductase-like oxidoreductase